VFSLVKVEMRKNVLVLTTSAAILVYSGEQEMSVWNGQTPLHGSKAMGWRSSMAKRPVVKDFLCGRPGSLDQVPPVPCPFGDNPQLRR